MKNKYLFAQELIKEAASFLREHMDGPIQVEEKSDFTDLVTNLDQLIQEKMTQAILERYPNDQIYGEEADDRPSLKEGAVWVLDPIDGTSNFIAQENDFAILLAYFEEGQGRFGLIYDVMQDQLYHGGGEFPAQVNDQPLSPYQEKELHQSLIALNAQFYAKNYQGIAELSRQCLGMRSYGSAGISMSHILSGRIMAYFSYLYPWDYAAAAIIGDSLGYEVLTLDGNTPSYSGREVVMMIPKAKRNEIKRYLTR